jgi:hypothetical protein
MPLILVPGSSVVESFEQWHQLVPEKGSTKGNPLEECEWNSGDNPVLAVI